MLFRVLLNLTLIFSTTFISVAQELKFSRPESLKVSSNKLKLIDSLLHSVVDSGWVKGGEALILKNGRIVYEKKFGKGLTPSPTTDNAIFRIASQTKPITSVAAMLLYERGQLLLNDPVSKYIPAFKSLRVLDGFNAKDSTYTSINPIREVTILDLMTHTAGIEYGGPGSSQLSALYEKTSLPSEIVETREFFEKEVLGRLLNLPLAHQPGAKFTYGYSTDILGYLVEEISGESLQDYFRNNIFSPFEMNDTFFSLPKEKVDRLATVFTEHNKKTALWDYSAKVRVDYPLKKGLFFAGGEGISTTTKDYAKFLQMLLDGGVYNGKRILSKSTIQLMMSNQIGNLEINGDKFGLGFMLTTSSGAQRRLGLSEGSFTWGGFFGTNSWADPKESLVGILFMQQWPLSHQEIFDKFKVLVYQSLK
ncbi:serine hydrolase domain-containing protein [Desertivirga brevis]|uniref:serine hydrolase domain-containing protein n=1 Tax=Desertivirga brevis TaxID=2810310 RepID=UPI001A9748C7|nr:serine hydrolase domain-containing protein [Pedobacter sp. SYSU D00873]